MVSLSLPASDHNLSPHGTLSSRLPASWISEFWILVDNQSPAALHWSLCSTTSTALFQKSMTHNGNRKLGFEGNGDLIDRIPEVHIVLRCCSRVSNQVRGGEKVLNNSSIVQRGSNGEAHRWTGWIMDALERRFGRSVLRRVDMVAISGGRRD